MGALSCASRTLETYFGESDLVFIGQVNEISKDEDKNVSAAEFEVNEIYKQSVSVGGIVEVVDTAFAGSAISFTEEGDSLLIFAQEENGRYITSDCNGSLIIGREVHGISGYDDFAELEGDLNKLSEEYEARMTAENYTDLSQTQNQLGGNNLVARIFLSILLASLMLLVLYKTSHRRKKRS